MIGGAEKRRPDHRPGLLLRAPAGNRPIDRYAQSLDALVQLAFPAVRTVEVSAERAGFGTVEVEQVGHFAFVPSLSLGVVKGCHAITLRIGGPGIEGYVVGSVVPMVSVLHEPCLFA